MLNFSLYKGFSWIASISKFGVFHKAILSSFILIFALFALSGCGYKDDPFYGDAPVKEKKTDKINKI
ncbi:hypothetical protein QM027_10540 [Campylobacter concisus]